MWELLPHLFSPICMEYLFSSTHFQSVCVFQFEVSPSQAVYRWIMVLVYSATRCLLIGTFSPFTWKDTMEKFVLLAVFVHWFLAVFIVLCSFLLVLISLPVVCCFYLVLCLSSFLFDFCIFCRFLVCDYCEVYISHSTSIAVYFKLISLWG